MYFYVDQVGLICTSCPHHMRGFDPMAKTHLLVHIYIGNPLTSFGISHHSSIQSETRIFVHTCEENKKNICHCVDHLFDFFFTSVNLGLSTII